MLLELAEDSDESSSEEDKEEEEPPLAPVCHHGPGGPTHLVHAIPHPPAPRTMTAALPAVF